MHLTIWTERRVAGGALAMSFLVLVFAAIFMLASGAAAGFGPMIRGSLAEAAPYVGTFRVLIFLFIVAWLVHLLGSGLLARLLAVKGEGQLAILAFILILVTTIAAVLNFGFRMTLELWAAREMAEVGTLPPLYAPLRMWTSGVFRLGYVIHFVAMTGIGWGILRSELLRPGLGWVTIGWSLLWFAGSLIGVGAPAIPLIMPAVIGFALLWR
jgi:hypothetical protein